MRKISLTLLTLLMLCGMGVATAQGIEMPDIGVNGVFLYSLGTNTWEIAPSVDVVLFTLYDDILTANAVAAFPEETGFLGGAMLKADAVKLLSKASQVTIITPFKLDVGLGIMVDLINLKSFSGDDLKNIFYPAVSIGVKF